ncbi:MAG: glycosyltransferase family 2 protein [Alistipes sp.]|nr:glycosyltransferase family 2 protein [Alistipes sp.]
MKILVLMSVYNGERYLTEQIESILLQDMENVDLLIRDDGSEDATAEVCQKYVESNSRVKFIQEQNCGAWKSFMELIRRADTTYDYYAFSDQDDVWLPEKLSRAVGILEQMTETDIPLLYGSNICPVNEALEEIHTGIELTDFTPSFGSSLIQGITSGLTCVFNKEALLKVRQSEPEYMIMHDWWLYLTVSCYGKVYYDNNAYVLYRQHGSNVYGARISRLERLKYRLKHYNERRKSVLRQTEEFLKCNPDMPEHNRKLAQLLCDSQRSMKKRMEYIFNNEIKRQGFCDNMMYRVLVLFGYL